MTEQASSLSIVSLFDSHDDNKGGSDCYQGLILYNLKKILPCAFFKHQGEQTQFLEEHLPLITFFSSITSPQSLSFFCLAKYRPNAFKFFFEMIGRWLLPGRHLSVVMVHASDFQLPDLTKDTYTLCEVRAQIFDPTELEEIKKNFPVLAAEIAFGIHSEFYAQRILEIKGLALDDKTISVQGAIAALLKRYPHIYDKDVLKEMQHLLVVSRDEFKAARDPRHLSRLISLQYLFRKMLREASKKHSYRRHLNLKMFKTSIHTALGKKKVLGIVVGLNFMREQETLGEKQLLLAVQHFIPSARSIDHSFFMHKLGGDHMAISYLEVEKEDGAEFSLADIRKLRRELPAALKNRVESRLHDLFMPPNEEEIMRHMLVLSQQIKFVKDIPQVIINFEAQSYSHIHFSVILARIIKQETPSLAQLLIDKGFIHNMTIDRVKIAGLVRKKYPKELAVLRLKIPKEEFLRPDSSLDFYKGRQVALKNLTHLLGEVRDYNGGMISQEFDLLARVRELLADKKEYDEWLLENFFYSLSPVVARALLDPLVFKTLFCLLMEGINGYLQEPYLLKIHEEDSKVYAVAIGEDVEIKEVLDRALATWYPMHLKNIGVTNSPNGLGVHIPSTDIVHGNAKTNGNICLGYVCSSKQPLEREKFIQGLIEALDEWASLRERGHLISLSS